MPPLPVSLPQEELFGLWQTKLRGGRDILLNPLLCLQLSNEAYYLEGGICQLCFDQKDRGQSSQQSQSSCAHEIPLDFTYHYEDSSFLLQVVREPNTRTFTGTLLNRDNGRKRPCSLMPFTQVKTNPPCPFCLPQKRGKRRRTAANYIEALKPYTQDSHIHYCVRWVARTSAGFDVIEDEKIEKAFRRFVLMCDGKMRAKIDDPGLELEYIKQNHSSDSKGGDKDQAQFYSCNFGTVNFDDFSLSGSGIRATGTDVVYRVSFAVHEDNDPETDACPSASQIDPVGSAAVHVLPASSGPRRKVAITLIHHMPRTGILPNYMVVACRGRPAAVNPKMTMCCMSCLSLCAPGRVCGSMAYRRAKRDPNETLHLVQSLYRNITTSESDRTRRSFLRKSNIQEDDVCVICLDSLRLRKVVGLPNCRHNFHTECINEYVKRMASQVVDCIRCPVCHVMQTRLYGNSPKALMYWSGSLESGWRVGLSVLPGIQRVHLHPNPGEKHQPWLAEFLLPAGMEGLSSLCQIKSTFALGQLLEVKDTGYKIGYSYNLSFCTHPNDDPETKLNKTRQACSKLSSVGLLPPDPSHIQIKKKNNATAATSALAQLLHEFAQPKIVASNNTDDEEEEEEEEDEEDDEDDEEDENSSDDDDEDEDLEYDNLSAEILNENSSDDDDDEWSPELT